jgi:hypothetical protein
MDSASFSGWIVADWRGRAATAGIGRDRIFAEPKLYEPIGTGEAIREQSSLRFGRPRGFVEKRLHAGTG